MLSLPAGVTIRRLRYKTPSQSPEAAHAEASNRANQAEARDQAALNALGPLAKPKPGVRFRRQNQVFEYEVESGSETELPNQDLVPQQTRPSATIGIPQREDSCYAPTETSVQHEAGSIRFASIGQDLAVSAVVINPEVETRAPEGLVAFEFRATCKWGTFVVFGMGLLAGVVTMTVFLIFLSYTSPYTCYISFAQSHNHPMLA
jgi:hypothetical protein